jgi:uncharacterized repeat protein (TIGR01451 family)
MNDKKICKNIAIIITICLMLSNIFIILPSDDAAAGSYNGADLALAILSNSSWLVSSSYTDTDEYGHRQSEILSSLGTMYPTNGPTFALLSTGLAGTDIVTTSQNEPGDEKGTWFKGDRYGYPRDQAKLTMTLQVPPYMHYIYYDVQFLSSEYPEYVGTQYNDKLTVTVNSPSEGQSQYRFDVNSGYFLLNSHSIPGTGFDIFAQIGSPGGVDWVDTTPRTYGADAGASDLIQMGGLNHPVSPNEQITVTFDIIDAGDNLFDSAAFIDNLKFTGFAKTEIMARKTVEDLNSQPLECGDTIKYRVTISNTGNANQDNNPGNEFEDFIPENTTYVASSATATSGTIYYASAENKITWNGEVPAESSVILEFSATVNPGLQNGTIISNQGTVFWDSNEDGTNDANELTDDAHIDDGIDQDGDGETDDDDPTDITVTQFEYPDSVTEGFSDDSEGGPATQSYFGRQWFETSSENIPGTVFEVVSGYHYSTLKSFKTKMRATGSPLYWNYSFDELDGDMIYWESWFACGDASEQADLHLDFQNNNGQDIAKLKLEYVQQEETSPLNWYLELYYYVSGSGWIKLNSDLSGGYLRNGWYKIRIEKNGENNINYILNRTGAGQIGFATAPQLSAEFENLAHLKFESTKNPIVCPMIFWDEHTIGLS